VGVVVVELVICSLLLVTCEIDHRWSQFALITRVKRALHLS
jgi:hypothetical protein